MSNNKEIQKVDFLQSGYETAKALYNNDEPMTHKYGLIFSKYATVGALAGAACLAISDSISGADYSFSIISLIGISAMMSVMYANIYTHKVRKELISEGIIIEGPAFFKETYRRHNLKKEKTGEEV